MVIAHRGASGQYPENTLLAFQKACEYGADGIEFDVHFTKDIKAVISHDPKIRGIDGKIHEISQTSLADIEKIELAQNQKVPRLKELFEQFDKKFSYFNVEIKRLPCGSLRAFEQLNEAFEMVSDQSKIIVSSFNPRYLRQIYQWFPAIHLAWLVSGDQPWYARIAWLMKKFSLRAVNLDSKMAEKIQYQKYFALPFPKWIWTVNEIKDYEYWIQQGVEAIMTDHPERLREFLDNL